MPRDVAVREPLARSHGWRRPRLDRATRTFNSSVVREKRGFLAFLGPGLITGASDDDPSGIATYSQVGAQFGYGLTWVMLFSWPLMAGIQEISARIGRVTGHGIAANIGDHYSPWLLRFIVALLIVANVINLGADLGAMAAGGAAGGFIGGLAQRFTSCCWRCVCAAPRDLRAALEALRLDPQMVDPVAVRLCRDGADRQGGLGAKSPCTLSCRISGVEHRFSGGRRRCARDDDQPLSVLLAGVGRGRGGSGTIQRQSR